MSGISFGLKADQCRGGEKALMCGSVPRTLAAAQGSWRRRGLGL